MTPVVAEVARLRKDVAKLSSDQASLTKERLAKAITFKEFEEEAATDGSHSLSAESIARLLASRASVHIVNSRSFTAHAVNLSEMATSSPSTWSATCGWIFSSRDAVLRTGLPTGSVCSKWGCAVKLKSMAKERDADNFKKNVGNHEGIYEEGEMDLRLGKSVDADPT